MEEWGFTDARNVALKWKTGIKERTQFLMYVGDLTEQLSSVKQYSRLLCPEFLIQ